MKSLAKNLVANILGRQVRRLRAKHDFKIVAVAGSVGKTSTKLGLAQVLSAKYRVRYQDGNYNDIVSVPLIFFGQAMPSLFNPLAWLRIFWSNARQISGDYPFDIVVVELGTDGPGQIAKFAKYLQADIGVISAIAPEHMEFFADLDAVAKEELTLGNYSDRLLVNSDLCDQHYLDQVKSKPITYSISSPADYKLEILKFDGKEYELVVSLTGQPVVKATYTAVAQSQLYSVCAAAAVAHGLGMTDSQIAEGIESIQPVSGRMRRLNGAKDSVILDDTYNASPDATKAALDALYAQGGSQKIAILGNMNELGAYSQNMHREVGEYCDPKQLDLIITIGPDANDFLAPAAEAAGCKVKKFDSPYAAGEYLKTIIKPKAVILAKGSQNRVFAEEAIKQILADPADAQLLVRQTPQWIKIKKKAFKDSL